MNLIQDIETEACRAWLPRRPVDCHKGDFGSVGVLGGAPGMAGAALLAARAALWLGAGRVYVGLLDERVAVDPMAPEVMIGDPGRVLRIGAPGCLVAGPGLGTSGAARHWLAEAIQSELPLLIDADGLNLLALDPVLRTRLKARPAPTLLTPHPGEAGRLRECSSVDIQADRPAALLALVEAYRCAIVLKGAHTLVHAGGEALWRNTSGNPGMAAPGMGDVLAGMIAALVAQGLTFDRAALLGVHLHGAAADAAVTENQGPVGLTAGEVARRARRLVNAWVYSP